MSFAAIRSIANSSLMATSVQMQVTSSNIANADVEGYTKKTATQTSTVSGSTVSGTSVTAITSDVDKYLLENLIESASDLSAATITESFADSLQALFGSTVGGDDNSGTSITSAFDELLTSLTDLTGTVESSSLSSLTVNALDDLASQVRQTASDIQDLRSDADGKIADAVDTANQAIETIDSLNEQIVTAKALGQSTADLEDKRNSALQSLAEVMDVNYTVTSSGQMLVSTTSGTPLVDGSAHTISYSPAATVTSDTVFSGIMVDGKDITSEIKSGSIGALLDQRDTELPAIADALDNLAATLIDTLNSVYNEGSSLPAPSTLTGTSEVSGSDALDATGTLRIALVESDGTTSSYADLDLSAYATVDDLVTALNGISGISASVTDGHLVISSTDSSLGVAVAGGSVGSDEQGVSDYFGLNDLLTGTSAADIRVRSDILSGDTAFATATLDTESALAAGDPALLASSTFVSAISSALEDDQNFSSAGALGATSTSFSSYAADIVALAATSASAATSELETAQTDYESYADAMSSATGVNVDEETARLSELEQQYSTTAQLLEVLNEMFNALLEAAQSAS